MSVIIPTYSRPDNILRAINSVLSQTYKNIEIIVVDDNGIGTPCQIETETVLQDYIADGKITYLKHEINKNGSAARNTGIKASKGEFITFLDDDDEYKPEKVEKQLYALQLSDDKVGAVYSGYRKVYANHIVSEVHPKKSGNLQKELLEVKWGFGTGSNPMFRSDVFKTENVGLWDESFKRHQDWEIMVRLFRKYEIKAIEDVLVIKNIDSKLLRPSADKCIETTDHYLSVFNKEIDAFGEKVGRDIRYIHWMNNAFLALSEHRFKCAFSLIEKAARIKGYICVKDVLRIIVHCFSIRINR